MNEPGQWQQNPLKPDTIAYAVFVQPIEGGKSAKIQLIPIQNIPDLWQAFAYSMEATGVMAASFSQSDNPKGIKTYEDMADYVAEYITKVIMNAKPKEGL